MPIDLDKLLTHAGSTSGRELYVRRTIYVSFRLAFRFRRLCAVEGFRLGDFSRILILLGLVYGFSRLGEEEWRSKARLTATYLELRRLNEGATKRSYPIVKGARGCWVTVSMPRPLLHVIELYAMTSGESRNNTLTLLFRNGLLLYLLSKKKFLTAITATNRKQKHHSHQNEQTRYRRL